MINWVHSTKLAGSGTAVAVLVLGLTVATTNAEVIYVCWDGSGDYLTIQEGIDAAGDGDEVVVCDGTYTGPGNKNIDFDHSPTFSAKYLLRGEDEFAVRSLFDGNLLSFFENDLGWCVEGGDQWLIVYRT